MTVDYYEEALLIAEELDAESHSAEAATLRESIDAGSTATEILMGLRWHLRRIADQELVSSQKLKERIQILEAALVAALDVRR